MKRKTWLSLCAAAFSLVTAFAAHADDQALVEQNFPQHLVDEYYQSYQENPGDEPVRLAAFTRADLDGSGRQSYIAAVYTNAVHGVLRVLAPEGDSARLVAESSFSMSGITPEVTAVNLDNQGGDELIVTLGQATGNRTSWIYRWNGSALGLMTPMEGEGDDADTVLVNAAWEDVDGDGLRELLVPDTVLPFPEDVPLVVHWSVLHWNGGEWMPAGSASDFTWFYRQTGAPKSGSYGFDADPGAYVLRIVNGEPDGANRVSSATLTLNGETVVSQNAFSQNVRVIEVPVTLAADNTLSAQLDGAPGGNITVVLLRK